MTKASYNRLSDEEKKKHDDYMAKYYAGKYYASQMQKYMPQCMKMDKFHLAYAITGGSNLFGLDHFAWLRLKEVGPEYYQLKHIVQFCCNNDTIREEAQELLTNLAT